jgi:hypothetical protein
MKRWNPKYLIKSNFNVYDSFILFNMVLFNLVSNIFINGAKKRKLIIRNADVGVEAVSVSFASFTSHVSPEVDLVSCRSWIPLV